MPNKLVIGRKRIVVTVATAGTAVPILVPAQATVYATDFECYALPTNAGNNFYIGNPDVDNTWIPRPKGMYFNFVHGTGVLQGNDPVAEYDLSKIYINADADTSVVIVEYNSREKYPS